MTLPSSAIESAAIARYRGDATLQALMTGATAPLWNIFDANGVPVNQLFPYVVVNIPVEESGAGLVMGLDGVDSYLYVNIFTQAGLTGGLGQARGIAKQIYALTSPAKVFDLSASGLVNFFCLFKDKQEKADGITQQIVMRFKLMTQG